MSTKKSCSRISPKLLSMTISVILLGGVLTSCGANTEDVALKADCKRILTYLKSIENTPEIFENSSVADSDSVALLLGLETRKKVEKKILALFPVLDDIVVGRAKDKQQVNPYAEYSAGEIYIIEKSLIGTTIKFPYTQDEVKAIAADANSWKKIVNPLAIKIYGDYFELKNHKGCAVVDNALENPDVEKNTSVAFSRATDVYTNYASFLQAVRDCDVSGWHSGNKCQKVDYVSSPDKYKPSNELTPEEKEILAERERDAQNGSQGSSGSSGSSDVKAGQACLYLGQVVSTSDYGNLTCKVVIVGRLVVQMWMRS